MLLVILLLVLVFYLNKLTRAYNKGGWWIGFILPPHFWSPWLFVFCQSHSVYLWFSPCCTVEFYRFVALWPFVSAIVEFLIFFAHVYLFFSFFFFFFQHITALRFVCSHFNFVLLFLVHQLLFSLLTAMSSNKMFPVVFNASVTFSVSYPKFLTYHWLMTLQIT